MTVTNQDSAQVAGPKATPPVVNPPSDDGGRVRVKRFNFTQAGAGDANSFANLVRLPGGKVSILEIFVKFAAMGTARTMDIGYAAHSDTDGAAVAASEAAYLAALDVASAGEKIVKANAVLNSRNGVTITAKIESGTIADLKTIDGYILYSSD